ncbi:hypothetical protein Acr_16g0001720 [Actinidia rufa]|uniref:Uncharacterized protein n=1 Tax=Actinidia rufa TaxID=165716 RepID=A0A7J0G049_9ERIC|nr:hypothetical protein Acr_16g0001720 [Actinidia rufa]
MMLWDKFNTLSPLQWPKSAGKPPPMVFRERSRKARAVREEKLPKNSPVISLPERSTPVTLPPEQEIPGHEQGSASVSDSSESATTIVPEIELESVKSDLLPLIFSSASPPPLMPGLQTSSHGMRLIGNTIKGLLEEVSPSSYLLSPDMLWDRTNRCPFPNSDAVNPSSLLNSDILGVIMVSQSSFDAGRPSNLLHSDSSGFCPPCPFVAEIGSTQEESLIVVPQKIVSSLRGSELSAYDRVSQAKQGCKSSRRPHGQHPSLYLANPPSRASVPNQPNAEGGDGTLSPHLHPKRESSTSFLKGNHYLHLKNPLQPQTRDDSRWSFPRYNGRLLDNFNNKFKRRSKECKESIKVINNRNRVPPLAEPKVPAGLISILSSDNKHSNDLAFALLQLSGEVEIVHSFREDNNTDASSGEVPLPTPGPLMDLAAQVWVELSSSKAPLFDKCKGTEHAQGPFQKVQEENGVGGELNLPPFFERERRALEARVLYIMLPKDVVDLAEEGSEEIRDLLERDSSNTIVTESWEKMMEEKAYEVLEKAPDVADELGQEGAAAAEDGAAATKDGAAAKEAFRTFP